MDSASSVLAIHRAIPYSDPALPSSSFATGSFLYSDSCQRASSLTLSGPCRMIVCVIQPVSDHVASRCNGDVASRTVNTYKLSCMDYRSLRSQNMSRVVLNADQS